MTYPYLGNKNPQETNMKFRISSPKPNDWEEKWPPYNTLWKNADWNPVFTAHWTQIETTWQALLSRGQINKEINFAGVDKVWEIPHKNQTFERRQCIPNMRFVRKEAYSSSYWLIWRLRWPWFHYMPQISCKTCCQIQTFGFVNASILLIKIGDVKLRER